MRWSNCLLVFVAWNLLALNTLLAEEAPSLEYQVKGAFLIKFGMFVEWPESKQGSGDKAPFVIGILGRDPFGTLFDEAVKKEKVNGRQVKVKRGVTAVELYECQIVFVSSGEMELMSGALSQLSTNGVLTVGDSHNFARNGGMVGFIKEGGKVRFEINTAVAEKSGLKMSSKLLQVGKVVTGGKTNHG
jgi:hypothetical protein